MIEKGKGSGLTIVIIIISLTIVTSNINWGKDHWKGIIQTDAKGYYAYLPAIFIYRDLNFGFFELIEKNKYYDDHLYYDYRIGTTGGKIINKYYCGTALVEMPFFLVAHFSSRLFNFEQDGFSKLYPVFISIAALFYLLIGLLFLDKLLKLYKISDFQRILVIIASVFGTNLFYYTIGEPGMSHLYSFAFVTMFLYYVKLYFQSFRPKLIVLLSIILGIIVLIRPVNGLVVFTLPFLSSEFNNFKNGIIGLIKNKWYMIFGLLVFCLITSLQIIYYKLATGNFLVYSYGEEGFKFLSPHFFDILFSYKKGLFIYTPIYLLSLFGIYFLWKRSGFEFYSIVSFLVLLIYVFSSWWMWYYGGSFSSRVFVEFISIFMILLALVLQKIQSVILRKIYIFAIMFMIVLCQFQTYLYRYEIIHWSDMNKESYWNSYLEIGRLLN